MEVNTSEIVGYANPYIDAVSEKDKGRYFDANLEMPYARVEGGIAVLYLDEWYMCVPKESVKE